MHITSVLHELQGRLLNNTRGAEIYGGCKELNRMQGITGGLQRVTGLAGARSYRDCEGLQDGGSCAV